MRLFYYHPVLSMNLSTVRIMACCSHNRILPKLSSVAVCAACFLPNGFSERCISIVLIRLVHIYPTIWWRGPAPSDGGWGNECVISVNQSKVLSIAREYADAVRQIMDTDAIMAILAEDYAEHQIIIASIYNSYDFADKNIIELQDRLLPF